MDSEKFHHRNRDRLGEAWRGTRFALVLVAMLLAMSSGGAGCSSDDVGGDGPAVGKPKLPVPAEFRAKLSRLVHEEKWAKAVEYLREIPPEVLARSASEKSDIQYFVVMGFAAMLPGLEPHHKPAREWRMPGTSDYTTSEDELRYNHVAYDFAKAYNLVLAKEEGGVR